MFLFKNHISGLYYEFVFFCDFRYFLAEIERAEQKSDSEAEKGLQMLLDSDPPALKTDFLELQKPKWQALNCCEK